MNSSKEDFRLRIFLTLAREKSFSKTAEALGKTQPAISTSLSELERIYGVKLIRRDKSGNSLTEEGKIFREYAERVEGAYRDLALACEGLNAPDGPDGQSGDSDAATAIPRYGETLAVETVRGLLPVLRKMDLSLAEEIEAILETKTKGISHKGI